MANIGDLTFKELKDTLLPIIVKMRERKLLIGPKLDLVEECLDNVKFWEHDFPNVVHRNSNSINIVVVADSIFHLGRRGTRTKISPRKGDNKED